MQKHHSTEEVKLRATYGYLQKDFVETNDGLVFALVSTGTEQQRVLAFLRYAPSAAGPLAKVDTLQANAILSARHPDWIYRSPSMDAEIHGVPLGELSRHFRPAAALGELANETRHPVFEMVKVLNRNSTIPLIELGITGSYLVRADHAESDIDLIVYGMENFRRLQRAIEASIRVGSLQSLTDAQWQASYQRRGCALTLDEYLWHERRKLNKFSIDGRKVDVSCVSEPHSWERKPTQKLEHVTVRAQVTGDNLAFASPAVFDIAHASIHQIIAFTPTYCGQAQAGEWLEACGWLEEQADGTRRVVVGSSREAPGEYLRVVSSAGRVQPMVDS